MNEVADKEFIHLKIHTQYSICEGALRILDLAKHCKTNQIKAAGLCDSKNLCGSLEFSELIAKSRTQPIIGTQINVLYKNHIGKIPLFAKDLEGYKNLIKLSSKSFLEIKDNEEPHCKIEDIENNYKGLILLSGSFDGLIGKLFFKNLSEEIFLLFPDPWPKKRHHKRRLIKPAFIKTLAEKLKLGGEIHLATDYKSYALEILGFFEKEPMLKNKNGTGVFLPQKEGTPKSKYEKKFINAGERIFYLEFTK